MNLYLASAAALAGYMALVFVLGKILHIEGTNFLLFFGILSALGLTAAGVFLWFKAKMQRQNDAEGAAGANDGGNDEISLLARDAEARLAASKLAQGAGLRNLPVIFLVGDRGTTKTSVMVHSGLEPELLAGQVFQENAIVPTRSANFWFARKAAFVEAGGRLLAEPQSWRTLMRRLQPGRFKSAGGASGAAPRAAIVCFDCENFTKPGADTLAGGAARFLQARLGEVSETLGISFPVYVLFTKADRLPFFADFVRNLTNEEATQIFGATLPARSAQSSGVYAEEESRRLSGYFDGLFYSLADKRLNLLPRENDQDRLPGAYEFPREFRKIRNALVQYLVDLCRPSQLRASPFLRGFYFTGVRPVIVNEFVAPATPQPRQSGMETASSATGVFKVPGQAPAPQARQPQVSGTRKVPQWLFLSHLFNDVILQDDAAMGASGASTRTSMMRRVLLATVTGLLCLFSLALIISFFGNHSLESGAITAAKNIANTEAAGENLASLDSLQKLERLRQSLERLTVYEQDGAPLHLRWGLYSGSSMYPEVRRLYYARFRQLLFGQTQSRMLAYLERLPATPEQAFEYGTTYDTLKAYLITTSNHDKSSRSFLLPVLMSRWTEGRDVDSERVQLARKQFDFYSDDLRLSNPYSSDNDAATVDRARRYLAQFSGTERVYQFMLAEASRQNPPVNFNQRFPGSADVVVNNRDVAGAFTKGGWSFMQNAIKRADQFFGGERWVLGDYAASAIDRGKLETDLRDRYTNDFIAAWRGYINNSKVVPYSNLKDAAAKLNKLSGNQSPLLALLWLASQNTAVDSPKVTDAFQPVQQVVPPAMVDRYVGATNQPYMNSLLALQSAIEQAASQPTPDPNAVNATMQSANSAKIGTKQLAQGFRIDPDGHVEEKVEKLLEDPITYAEALVRAAGPAELNAKGRALCGQFAAMTSKFPFNPRASAEATLQEVAALLRPRDGALWAFYDANLKSVLQKQGNQYATISTGGVSLNPAFVNFFNTAARFGEAVYPNGSMEPHFSYTLQPNRSDQVQSMSLTIDGQNVKYKGPGAARQFVWPGNPPEVQLSAKLSGGTDFEFQNREGLWSVFHFFADADQWTLSGNGFNLDWVVRQGREGRPVMIGGKPLTYEFFLDTGGAPPIFRKEYLNNLRCVANVAR